MSVDWKNGARRWRHNLKGKMRVAEGQERTLALPSLSEVEADDGSDESALT